MLYMYIKSVYIVLLFVCFSNHRDTSTQQSVTRSDRQERRDDSYIHAPAEQIFDTDDSYFRSSGGAQQQEVGGVSRGQGQEKMSGQHYHHYESSSQSAGTRSDGVRY